ncbi:hypothetical protein FSP39_001485 [Pinctada imbricata]|uniref:Ig-like domain-containing protein n=1 Tax=Pinctada imbricata TaxID=66713 RepID=A0AA89BMQ0_PINIB|nr:hypothetical protein FSP39_001485 [Pinctada imbricata]
MDYPGLYPKLTTFPKLGNPEVTPNKTVRFPCTIDYPKRESDVSFEVTWTVDGHELRDPLTHRAVVSVLTGVKRTAYLNVDKLQGNLDKYLRCNVTSFHTNTPGVRSDPIPSNPYFVGFKVSTDSVVVDEKGDKKTITIESTLPIPCNALSQYDCKFPIEIHQGKDPTDLSWKSCTYDLKKDPIDGKYRTTITVKATRYFITDHDKVHDIAFEPLFSLMNPVWIGYNISHIHVKTLDADVTDCTSSGDPHLRGFTHKKSELAH